MNVLGIDLAAAAKKTYACALVGRDGGLVAELFAECDDDRLLTLAEGMQKVAIDAPFGWPRAFVEALAAHRRFETWPAPDDGPPERFRAALSFRATDRVVMHTRRVKPPPDQRRNTRFLPTLQKSHTQSIICSR